MKPRVKRTAVIVAAVAMLLGLANNRAEPIDQPIAAGCTAPISVAVAMAVAPVAGPVVSALELGRRGYRRSCVHCHGIQPKGLRYQSRQRFADAVLQGTGAMPALGFKLTAREVELIRRYVAGCAPDYQRC